MFYPSSAGSVIIPGGSSYGSSYGGSAYGGGYPVPRTYHAPMSAMMPTQHYYPPAMPMHAYPQTASPLMYQAPAYGYQTPYYGGSPTVILSSPRRRHHRRSSSHHSRGYLTYL